MNHNHRNTYTKAVNTLIDQGSFCMETQSLCIADMRS